MADDLWDDIIETNLNSVFRVTREVLRNGGLLADGGRIVSVSSTGGKQGVALAAPYCASKSGIIGFTKSVALELALSGVTVNAVCPGFVETPMAERVRAGHAAHFGKSVEEVQRGFEANIPIGRYVAAEEVAGMISFLATKDASSVTGQAINVCGGLGRY
jgi:ketoreductase